MANDQAAGSGRADKQQNNAKSLAVWHLWKKWVDRSTTMSVSETLIEKRKKMLFSLMYRSLYTRVMVFVDRLRRLGKNHLLDADALVWLPLSGLDTESDTYPPYLLVGETTIIWGNEWNAVNPGAGKQDVDSHIFQR